MPSNPAVRKLTTILAADVVGYSRLMSANEEQTLDTLRTYRGVFEDRLARHGGRIFNTAGDAILAEFGSPVEAVRCAIAIQEDIAARNAQRAEDDQMWFRIGINVGDIMVEGDDLFGDGVNIASRLESLADKGGITISGSTFDQVRNKLSVAFSDLGPQSVKNIPDPVPAFRVTSGPPKRETGPGRPARTRRVALLTLVAAVAAMAAGWILLAPRASDHPFDGRWQVSVHSRSGCLSNDPTTYPIRVAQGEIDEPDQRLPKSGSITADGRFRIEVFNPAGKHLNTQEGRIDGDTGTGTFTGSRPSCTGQVDLTRQAP